MPESPLFDFQASGFGGVEFQRDGLSTDEMRRATSALRSRGVGAIFAALVTADLDRLRLRPGATLYLDRAAASGLPP